MIVKNQELRNHYISIISFYQNKINIILKGVNVLVEVRLTHRNTNLCFNCCQREMLYSIQKCFNDDGYNDTKFQESILGKALIIPIENVETNVSFDNFMKHYPYYFMKRLLLIEIYFDSKKMNYKDCLYEKQMLLNKYSIVHKLPQFPIELNRHIQKYLIPDINQYLKVRNLYEKYRTL